MPAGTITGRAFDRVMRAVRWIENHRDRAKPRKNRRPAPDSIWAKITGSAAIPGTANRYRYAWTEQRPTATGFADHPDGRSGTTTTGYALNSAEAGNTATGIQGTGVDHDGPAYPPGFSLQPVRGNPVVRIYVGFAGGLPTYSFELDNAEDGTCT